MDFDETQDRGFAIIPDVFAAFEIAGVIDSLAQTRVPHSRAGIRHLMADPHVASFARSGGLIEIASAILRKPAIPYRATLFDKSPDVNWKVTWHQDTALPLKEKKELRGWGPWSIKDGLNYTHATAEALEQIIALRIHLDPSTESNGPLRVIPGTHNLGVLSDEEVARISVEREAITCCGSRGSVLAMRPLLIHSSSKSTTDEPRRVLHIEYASSLLLPDGMRLAFA